MFNSICIQLFVSFGNTDIVQTWHANKANWNRLDLKGQCPTLPALEILRSIEGAGFLSFLFCR